MKNRLLSLLLLSTSAAHLMAADWELRRFDGRDYVTMDSLAAFYGFPAPPHIGRVPFLGPPAPGAAEDSLGFAPAIPDFTLRSGSAEMTVILNSTEILINGVRQWLAFPVRVDDGHAFVSRLDLAKEIEPRLRPEKIEGLAPVETVVLDPGHGAHDKGATSRYGFEKDFALDVALRARELLEANRYKVVMTRSSDIFIPLEERAEIANRIPNSVFVSIHFNASNTNALANGFEIFSIAPRGAPSSNDGPRERDLREEPGNVVDLPSTALAATVYHSLLGHIPIFDRGLKHARFAVLRRSIRPAVLVECGFVSNGPESALIGSPAWRRKLAESIVDGIDNYKGLAERGQRPKVMADYRREPLPTAQ
ncbi:MAG TPA: N-acetylmuramoyl-L-alanine amidase [Chthoniobacteraceae bacterium]|nr:N-acetylmuramoyl-L-alanine amidase [Chthoniobacteraceae bacterium]